MLSGHVSFLSTCWTEAGLLTVYVFLSPEFDRKSPLSSSSLSKHWQGF